MAQARRLRKAAAGTGSSWTPNLHQIEKWWDEKTLASLADLFAGISNCEAPEPVVDLLKIAFCKVMIATSNASFGHQSMSFKKTKAVRQSQPTLFADFDDSQKPLDFGRMFAEAVDEVAEGLTSEAPTARGEVFLGDSRHLDKVLRKSAYSTVITSPPYPNRMSYIRELRPYMYWLGFLESGRQAGENANKPTEVNCVKIVAANPSDKSTLGGQIALFNNLDLIDNLGGLANGYSGLTNFKATDHQELKRLPRSQVDNAHPFPN